MRIAIGIDPSLAHTGVCRLYDGAEHLVTELGTAPGPPRPQRLVDLREAVRAFLHTSAVAAPVGTGPVVVALETEIWMGVGHTAAESAATQAVFQVLLWELRTQWAKAGWPPLRYLPVNVSQVKKWVDAKEKQHILMKVYKQYGREFTNDNEADAFVLAHIADAFSRASQGEALTALPQRQREVLLKLACPWEAAPSAGPRAKKTRPAPKTSSRGL